MEVSPEIAAWAAIVDDLYLQGRDPLAIVEELQLTPRDVHACLRHLESVMLLEAHGFPRRLVSMVLSLSEEEAQIHLMAIQARLGGSEQLLGFLRKQMPSLWEEGCDGQLEGSAGPFRGGRPRGEDVRALDVLEFWASKWL